MANLASEQASMEEFLLQPLTKEGRPPSTITRTSLDPVTSVRTQRNSYEILGKQGAIFVAFGSATIVATLGFFVFLWFSDESNSFWKRIMLANWGVRSVTITAVLSRWVVASQAALATSMLAGLILERPKVPLSDSAPLSLMRFNNSGPWDLTFLLSGNRHRITRYILYGLALSLTLSTTLLQFTSTILLSDFTIASIQSESENLTVNYGWNLSNLGLLYSIAEWSQYPQLWQARPAFYPTFAEHMNATPVVIDGVHDSGVILRSYFPLSSASTRSTLHTFKGVSSVLGMRTICGRPDLDYDLNIGVGALSLSIELTASTNISDTTAPGLDSFSFDTIAWTMNCSVPLPGNTSYAMLEWTLSLCYNSDASPDADIPVGFTNIGYGFVVFNVTGSADSWWDANFTNNLNHWTHSTHGEWASITSQYDGTTLQLDMSICTMVYSNQNLNILASSTSNRTEPSVTWDAEGQKFNTSAIRQQLGATLEPLTLDERGLFSLEWPINLTSGGNIGLENTSMDSLQSWEGFSTSPSLTSNSLASCQYCIWDPPVSALLEDHYQLPNVFPDAVQSAIFQQILEETSHPATALQAYGTLQYSMYYYLTAMRFDIEAPASITNFVLRIQPTARRGFVIFSIIIVLHLALILCITGLFLSSKRHTMLNNSWQAIAQLVSPETAPILEFADRATDSEVNNWIKKKEKGGNSFGIMEGDDGMRLRRCTD